MLTHDELLSMYEERVISPGEFSSSVYSTITEENVAAVLDVLPAEIRGDVVCYARLVPYPAAAVLPPCHSTVSAAMESGFIDGTDEEVEELLLEEARRFRVGLAATKSYVLANEIF